MSVRLLFITSETFPTFRADVDVLFGKYLSRLEISSDIVAGKTEGYKGELRWAGGEVFHCRTTGGRALAYLRIFAHSTWLLISAQRDHYTAVQVRDRPVFALVALLIAKMKRMPFYYWMSFPMPEGHLALATDRAFSAGMAKYFFHLFHGLLGKALLYGVVLPFADHLFVQSDRMREVMASRGVVPGKMTTVPMGVDWEQVQCEKMEPIADSRLHGRKVLIYLGSLDRARCIEVLFPMLALVKAEIPEALLVLVGDTEDYAHRADLRSAARVAGIADDVVWTGWLPMREAWRYVKAADVGLSPIPRGALLDVSSPTKVLEYLALGVPVVCNDNPDQERIVERSGAGLCVRYTARDFADAVLALLAIKIEKRLQMVECGKQYVSGNRSYELIAARLAKTYEELSLVKRKPRS